MSALLGEEPPRLPVSQLVRLAAAFDINENRARVALSRMVTTGEVRAVDATYELLSPSLLARQSRLRAGRAGRTRPWTGAWFVVIIDPTPASPSRRTARRAELRRAGLAELRDGVWVRPDNLANVGHDAPALGLTSNEVHIVRAQTFAPEDDDAFRSALSAAWDLDHWAAVATDLLDRLATVDPADRANLAPGFELSAACLRHLQTDPLLPAELLPADWPGPALRAAYGTWDRSYRAVLQSLRR